MPHNAIFVHLSPNTSPASVAALLDAAFLFAVIELHHHERILHCIHQAREIVHLLLYIPVRDVEDMCEVLFFILYLKFLHWEGSEILVSD